MFCLTHNVVKSSIHSFYPIKNFLSHKYLIRRGLFVGAATEYSNVLSLMASDYFLLRLEETGRALGRDAYGEVVEMSLHGAKVAGKKIGFKDRETSHVYINVNILYQVTGQYSYNLYELLYAQSYMYCER